ncbi:hypothetical protein GAY28_24970, partial [Azospirillum brasilense]|nr:hypothetical protein [Azospirillum brasilense]
GRGVTPPPRPPLPPAPATTDPLRRLEAHLEEPAPPQAAQLRRRPEALRRYAAAFELYRALSVRGERPTRGALAAAFATKLGLTLTPSQIQKLRDQVEGFARPGGPWHVG